MFKKIGIPRALLYYDYYPLWHTFFENVGAEIVLSDRTNNKILNDGVKYCINEACLPVKLFHGHIVNLIGKADCLFVPRMKSVARNEYICPKFTGLPDMIRSSVPNLPPIIDCEVNLRKSNAQLKEAFFEAGSFFTEDKARIWTAAQIAMEANDRYRKQVEGGRLPAQILENRQVPDNDGLRIAVIGHIYNLYDDYINRGLLGKLYENGARVFTPELIQGGIVDGNAAKLDKKVFWSFARRLMGAAMHFAEQKNVDGVIYLMSFGCGIDSFIAELCERRLRRQTDIPFYLIVLDEHSGEAGINTRLEAFIDMLKWRKRNDSDLSAHG
ncbi:MAG: acyl-CoA dehydratase activase-related protein [Clostridia bacterium]|nr:acyl-CoA dehydratase activase-related protein [Clostridia bacterium]